MLRGIDPVVLLHELRTLGEAQILANPDAIPALEDLSPLECWLGWTIELRTTRGKDAVQDVFLFVEDDCVLTIEDRGPVANSSAVASAPSSGTRPKSETVAGDPPPTDQARDTATEKTTPNASSRQATVRVAAEKLDRLVGLVGELVINQSRLTQAASRRGDQELMTPVEEIERLVAELRDSVLGIRMTAIGATFNRFRRLVHDLSGELGKEIDLVLEGTETELDKTVLDQLGDPLVHLVRNSIDHGIEPVEKRLASGKSRRGTLRLSAAHIGSNVVVQIEDDGKGLDVNAIRNKALERGLITADQTLSESETFALIFLPGFSTASQVTSVSGRGVGMDVVKRQIETLRGSIQISSQTGKGTVISLTLPLTLAIIDGLLIEVGQDQFIVPMSAVTESVELHQEERARNNGRNVLAIRGELIPFIDLRNSFTLGGAPPPIEKVVIVRHQNDRVGLTVDRVVGSHQTVIQSLGQFYRNIEVVSGATITGDGRVALILDIAGLVRYANRLNHPAAVTPLSIRSASHRRPRQMQR